jgi:hypothetical protein
MKDEHMLMYVLVFVLGFMVARLLGDHLVEGDVDLYWESNWGGTERCVYNDRLIRNVGSDFFTNEDNKEIIKSCSVKQTKSECDSIEFDTFDFDYININASQTNLNKFPTNGKFNINNDYKKACFYIEDPTMSDCTCPNGKSEGRCSKGAINCRECNKGYTLNKKTKECNAGYALNNDKKCIIGYTLNKETNECVANKCTCDNGTPVIGDMSSQTGDFRDICISGQDGGSLCLSNSCHTDYKYKYINLPISVVGNVPPTSKCEKINYCTFSKSKVKKTYEDVYKKMYPGSLESKQINAIDCWGLEGCPSIDQKRFGNECICKDPDKNIDENTGKCVNFQE